MQHRLSTLKSRQQGATVKCAAAVNISVWVGKIDVKLHTDMEAVGIDEHGLSGWVVGLRHAVTMVKYRKINKYLTLQLGIFIVQNFVMASRTRNYEYI